VTTQVKEFSECTIAITVAWSPISHQRGAEERKFCPATSRVAWVEVEVTVDQLGETEKIISSVPVV